MASGSIERGANGDTEPAAVCSLGRLHRGDQVSRKSHSLPRTLRGSRRASWALLEGLRSLVHGRPATIAALVTISGPKSLSARAGEGSLGFDNLLPPHGTRGPGQAVQEWTASGWARSGRIQRMQTSLIACRGRAAERLFEYVAKAFDPVATFRAADPVEAAKPDLRPAWTEHGRDRPGLLPCGSSAAIGFPLGAFDCIVRRGVLGERGIRVEIDRIVKRADGPGARPVCRVEMAILSCGRP